MKGGIIMENNRYATKKKGKTEVYPFWNLEDIKNMVEWFENHKEWDGYLITMFELLLGRRIGDTVSMKWSDLYYENGNKREEIVTIEEQKTGKTTELPISSLVFESVEKYCEQTKTNPMEHYNEYIFNFQCKTAWMNRKDNPIYLENDLEKWCKFLNKDFSDRRKEKILSDYKKQKLYLSLGDYLYYEVEQTDVIKWETDTYRKLFNKAAADCCIEYRVSTHSLRKSFGYWIYKIHPFDPDCLLSLQKLLNHSDVQTTMDYIGLTTEKNRRYINEHGELIKNALDGNTDKIIKNSPVISLRTEDYGDIIMKIINEKDLSDVEKYQMAINMANEMRVIK
jgi:integrase